jgi:uncharacterized protein with HEPN domain
MKKDVETFIEHILECVELIEQYTDNKTEDDFFDSIQLQDSVIRRIEIIGEAVKNKRRIDIVKMIEILGVKRAF